MKEIIKLIIAIVCALILIGVVLDINKNGVCLLNLIVGLSMFVLLTDYIFSEKLSIPYRKITTIGLVILGYSSGYVALQLGDGVVPMALFVLGIIFFYLAIMSMSDDDKSEPLPKKDLPNNPPPQETL